jgi:type I restriction-modification system DNA methylase subunit
MAEKNTANIGFEKQIWDAACVLWGHIPASEYRNVIIGLIFLKYISTAFDKKYQQLVAEGDGFENDPDAYLEDNVFFVPEDARWDKIAAAAHKPEIGTVIDDAMRAIEADNKKLKNVLPKNYASPDLDKRVLGDVVDLFTNMDMGETEGNRDVLGRTYEYCIAQFAEKEGKGGGEFYTPSSIVNTLVSILKPYSNCRVYDCCCGSGGMFVQSAKFIQAHSGNRGSISIYGQEANPDTWKMAIMNLTIRGLDADLGAYHADTFTNNRFMGYTKDEDGHLIIEPAEAEIVKRIYREYLQGASLKQIGDGLMDDGILTAAGKAKWRPESVKKILKNEKYIGDALLQKTYTVDVLTKKRVKNNGIVPQYYVENSHEPIIPRDLYMQVQEEMVRRANLHSGKNRKKRVYSSKYALSSIVYCPKCGDIYRRVVWNNHGKQSVVWRCCTRMEHGPGTCNADAIHESELQNLVVRAINMALCKKDTMSENLQKNVEAVLTGADGIPLDEIDSRLEQLQKELLKVANAKGNYDSIADEIYSLREAKQNAQVAGAEREGMKKRISEMQQFLAEQQQDITEYDEQLVRRLIEKITVYDERVTVEFKSGTSVDVRR